MREPRNGNAVDVLPAPFREEAARLRADPRLRNIADELQERGAPTLFYRGTQRRAIQGVRKGLSFTDSLAVAAIWSAVPGDAMASGKESQRARLLPTSTVHAAYLAIRRPLVYHENHVTLGDVLHDLRFNKEGGITTEEVLRVYNYLHNRLTGRARGGEFEYKVVDEDGETVEWDSFSFTRTQILDERDGFEAWPEADTAGRLVADTFVFMDSPAVQEAARRQGFDGLLYEDAFQGGEYAALDILGRKARDLEGVDVTYGLDGDRLITHRTVRPLDEAALILVGHADTSDLIALID